MAAVVRGFPFSSSVISWAPRQQVGNWKTSDDDDEAMEWLFPSAFKISLFPAKSSGALAESSPSSNATAPREDGDEGRDEESEELSSSMPASSSRQQLRRRSSLSDLDALLLKDKLGKTRVSERLSMVNEDGGNNKRQARVFSLLLDGQAQPTDYPLSLSGSRGGSIGDMINLKLYGSSRSLVSMTSSIAESVPLETVGKRKATVTTSSSATTEDQVQPGPPHQQQQPLDDDVIIIEEEGDEDVEELVAGRMPKPTRAPSISERAMRLSLLIQKRQCRCSRYEEEVAVNKRTKNTFTESI